MQLCNHASSVNECDKFQIERDPHTWKCEDQNFRFGFLLLIFIDKVYLFCLGECVSFIDKALI